MLIFIVVFLTALSISFILTPLVRNIANRLHLVDIPSVDRQIHTNPIPRVGGIAIFIAFVTALLPIILFPNSIGKIFQESWPSFLSLMVPASIIFFLGVVDDTLRLSVRTKFAVQIFAALLFCFFSIKITEISNPFTGESINLGWIAIPITILWLVGITNAFNLIDGIDGLSAGSTLFASISILCVALINHNFTIAIIACTLAGATLGFLKYNFNPATIFMGDCGSLFSGFTLAALAIQGAQKSTTIITIAIPLVSFGLPVMETILSIVRRFLSGKPIFSADRRHIHHQLLAKGFSHRQAVILLYGACAFFALASLVCTQSDSINRTIGLILLVFGISIWIAIQHLGYYEFGEVGFLVQRSLLQRSIMVKNIRFRNILDSISHSENFDQIFIYLDECFRITQFNYIELCLPKRIFASEPSHQNFSINIVDENLVAIWVNPSIKTCSKEYIKLQVPFHCCENKDDCSITFSHALQPIEILFDIKLICENLPLHLSKAITFLSEKNLVEINHFPITSTPKPLSLSVKSATIQ